MRDLARSLSSGIPSASGISSKRPRSTHRAAHHYLPPAPQYLRQPPLPQRRTNGSPRLWTLWTTPPLPRPSWPAPGPHASAH